jgi:hypothetical protein
MRGERRASIAVDRPLQCPVIMALTMITGGKRKGQGVNMFGAVRASSVFSDHGDCTGGRHMLMQYRGKEVGGH